MFFLDESGFLLQPLVRRSWAPRGQTPTLDCWDRHGRLSVISAIRISPQGRRLELLFSVCEQNITAEQCEAFVVQLLRGVRNPVVLVWDRWSVHRCVASRLEKRFPHRLRVEWLPAYAPELNPVEQVWGNTKYGELANYIPEDLEALGRRVRRALSRTGNRPDLLRSFFRHAGLEL